MQSKISIVIEKINKEIPIKQSNSSHESNWHKNLPSKCRPLPLGLLIFSSSSSSSPLQTPLSSTHRFGPLHKPSLHLHTHLPDLQHTKTTTYSLKTHKKIPELQPNSETLTTTTHTPTTFHHRSTKHLKFNSDFANSS